MTKELTIAIPNTPEEFVKENVNSFLESVKQAVKDYKYPPDLNKKSARTAVRSFVSQNIVKRKTAADKAGKELVSDIKAKVKLIDEGRKEIRDTLDKLKNETLKPVVEFENKEKIRKETINFHIKQLKEFKDVCPDQSSEEFKLKLNELLDLDGAFDCQERKEEAEEALNNSKKYLELCIENAGNREKEAVRLAEEERKRKEQEQKERDERLKKEAAEKARKEAEEKAKREKEEAEEKARKERERIEREKIETELALKRAEEERQAAIEQLEREKKEAAERAEQEAREAQEKEEEAKRKAARDAEIAAKKAEEEKQATIEAERQRAEEERRQKAEEDRKRAADKAHRQMIHDEIETDLVAIPGISKELAEEIVLAWRMGKIRNVSINY